VTKQIVDSLLRDAAMCVKLAACGDVDSFAKATDLIERARAHLAGPVDEPSPPLSNEKANERVEEIAADPKGSFVNREVKP
jgi:hypothetical protein